MTNSSPTTELHQQASTARGAVPMVKPFVWWLAGGLGLLGAGALAAALVAGPAADPAGSSLASGKPPKAATAPATLTARCDSCGTVESVQAEKHKGEGTGLGAVGGAVLGGVVGHQLGDGNGKKALTVLGAVGGGLAGHEVEKQARSSTVYRVQMRMDDGSVRTVVQNTAPAVGARFEVNGTQLKSLAAAKG